MKPRILAIILSLPFLLLSPAFSAADEIGQIISKLTLPQKIGQVIFLGFQGRNLSSQDISHFQEINPGGIIFYGRNLREAADISRLISSINSLSGKTELPMFYAVDQEGGIVHRVEGEFFTPPSHPAIGATRSAWLAREVGLSVGEAIKRMGIGINLAPVLDMPAHSLNSPMAMRSFGNDPQAVAALGVAYIQGMQAAGLLAAAKHFPGLGRAAEDSHTSLPRITWQTQEERDQDMLPFRGAIEAGVDLVMVGHFLAEPGDAKNPVSLSSYWMEDVLRRKMGFKGLVIVDNIEMKPIENLMPLPEAAVKSFEAGADIIMVSHERKNQKAVFQALLNAVRRGGISPERLERSLRRVIEAKRRIQLFKPMIGSAQNLKDISRVVAENSVVEIRARGAESLRLNEKSAVLYVGYKLPPFKAVQEVFRSVDILNTPLSMYERLKPQIPLDSFLKKFDVFIIDSEYPDAREIISASNRLNKEHVVFSLPREVPKALTALEPKRVMVIFENKKANMQAALEILFGKGEARGKFPYHLTLPDRYDSRN